MSTKVKECTSCGQGFDEDNGLIGNRAPSIRCQNGHEGPIVRINTQGKLLLMPLLSSWCCSANVFIVILIGIIL